MSFTLPQTPAKSLFGTPQANSTVSLFSPSSSSPNPPRVDPAQELHSSLAKLCVNGSYMDLTIICGNDRYKVHRALICPRSTFFEAACKHGFKEGRSGEINLPDDDPVAVKMMIRYSYYLDYETRQSTGIFWTLPPTQATSTLGGAVAIAPNDLALHARIYSLGEKYDIRGLKSISAQKFERDVKQGWATEEFAAAIREVYGSTAEHDRQLRDVVLKTINEHPSLLDKKSIQEAIKASGSAFDLLMWMRKAGRMRS